VTRVVAGAARGRRLAVPPGRATRPTSDRAREALFSTLESLVGALAGRRFADLFAGSGAVGLEALSRGAAHVLLVDDDTAAVRTARANVRAVDLAGAEVRHDRVERVVAHPPATGPYDVVFLDPPYELADEALAAVLLRVVEQEWVVPDAVVVVERSSRTPWSWPPGYVAERSRRYGEATLWYGRAALPSETVGSEG
jgi:16S rRNA (guanine966-N2)-methyltransferase